MKNIIPTNKDRVIRGRRWESKSPPILHTYFLTPSRKWSYAVTSLSTIYKEAPPFPGTEARSQGAMPVWEAFNEVTIKKELLIPGVQSPGERCQGECLGLGDLLILSGWCLNQEWLSKRFAWTEDGAGRPAPCSAWVFLPSPIPALLLPQEGIPGLVFDSLWFSDTFCYRISWRQGPRKMTLWQDSLKALCLFPLDQSLLSLFLLPGLFFMLMQQHHTPLPATSCLSLRTKAGTSPWKPSLWFPGC